MPKAVVIYRSDAFTLTSYGNGAFYEAVAVGSQGETCVFQGDDADTLSNELDATHEKWTYDDVLARYFGN